jgi:TRAP-type mannitol/chloroaromatic compound transport system permease large subunit
MVVLTLILIYRITYFFKREACPEGDLYRGVLPFVLADVVRIALLVTFPVISLWLPGMMMQR